jgi:Abortive infection C-terminus
LKEDVYVLKGKVEALQALLMRYCASGDRRETDENDYVSLREDLLAEPELKGILPYFVTSCIDLSSFWDFLKPKFVHWVDRRRYLRTEFERPLTFLENWSQTPTDGETKETLAGLNSQAVNSAWRKALDRKSSDPEGAITSARSLLESVCKHILDKKGISYSEGEKLPKLYSLTVTALKVAPNQQTDDAMKRILGGGVAIVEGLSTLRNRVGDAHGKGSVSLHPSPAVADLAVTMAGAISAFLVQTYLAQS